MQYYITEFSTLIYQSGKVIGNAQAYYNYSYCQNSRKLINGACFISANVFLIKDKSKIISENWEDGIIENAYNSEQGVELISELLKQKFGNSDFNMEVCIETYLLVDQKNESNHIYVQRYINDSITVVHIPRRGSYTRKVIKHSAELKEIGQQYLK